MRLHEAVGTGDHHAADGVRPHDVGVVVDLDAPDAPLDPERLAKRRQQLLLRGGLHQLAAEGFAAVLRRMVDQLTLLAALWHGDFDLLVVAFAPGRLEQRPALDLMRKQHEARRRTFVVELSEKGLQHFAGAEAPVGLRRVGTVAPVLIRAEEEHFDQELARLFEHGEDVGFLRDLGVDALRALDRGERRDAVAQSRRPLELERFRSRAHLAGQQFANRAALAGKEVARLADERRITVPADLARARPGAALDLVQQARPRAVLEIGVAARTHQKGALQRVQGAIDRPHAGERTEIVAFAGAGATMLGDLRRRVIAGEQDVGKRLVVAHQHVEAGLHLLDVVGLQKQRLRLRGGRDEHHGGRQRDHPRDAVGVAGRPHVAGDALADALCLADIEHGPVGPDHPINAGPFGCVPPMGADRRRAGLHRGRGSLVLAGRALQDQGVEIGVGVVEVGGLLRYADRLPGDPILCARHVQRPRLALLGFHGGDLGPAYPPEKIARPLCGESLCVITNRNACFGRCMRQAVARQTGRPTSELSPSRDIEGFRRLVGSPDPLE